MCKVKTIIIILMVLLLNSALSYAQGDLSSEIKDPELEQEMAWLRAETYVITPSRIPEKIKKTASSITVITDRQIRQMGAKTLVDVLERAVPGIVGNITGNPGAIDIEIRGQHNMNSNSILFMINGHPINEAQTEGGSWVYDTLIVDNIKRIEVLRSPGSAVYGANAFVGVFNIITKEAEDIDGLELTARGGSWDTQQYNLLFGKTLSDLEVTSNFNYFKTHGFRGLIKEDFQTQFDRIWGAFGFPPASLAPGRMAGDREKYDVALNLKYKGFKFDGRYVDKEWDFPIGWITALNHKSISSQKDYYLNLSYEASIAEGLDLFGKVYRNLLDGTIDIQIFPPGFIAQTPTPPFFSIMPDGMVLIWSNKASRTGMEIQTTYKISDSNTVVAGATYEEQKYYDHSQSANYLPTADPNVFIPLPSVTKLSDDLVEDTQKRNFKAFFLEDIWDITDDLRLTTGVRYDRYSDFGSEVSPRIGLTWEFFKGYDLKLLYGHAFRAPSFYEILSREPSSKLDPEKNDTYEVSIGADFTSSFSSRATFYYRVIEDRIVATLLVHPWNWANTPVKFRDHGLEIEAKYDFGRGTYLAGNYSYMSFNTGSVNNGPTVHIGKIMSNVRLSRYLNFYADCQFYDGMERLLREDDRDDPSGYAIVNATLIARKFLKGYEGLELRGSVYNLLDKKYSKNKSSELPNDWPMPDRHYLLELRYKF